MKHIKFSLIVLMFCCSIYGQTKQSVKPTPTPQNQITRQVFLLPEWFDR